MANYSQKVDAYFAKWAGHYGQDGIMRRIENLTTFCSQDLEINCNGPMFLGCRKPLDFMMNVSKG